MCYDVFVHVYVMPSHQTRVFCDAPHVAYVRYMCMYLVCRHTDTHTRIHFYIHTCIRDSIWSMAKAVKCGDWDGTHDATHDAPFVEPVLVVCSYHRVLALLRARASAACVCACARVKDQGQL